MIKKIFPMLLALIAFPGFDCPATPRAEAAELSGPSVWNMTELRAMENELTANGLEIRNFVEKPGSLETERQLKIVLQQKTLAADMDTLSRLTEGKNIPRLAFSGGVNDGIVWDVIPLLKDLRCSTVGLCLPNMEIPIDADLSPLRDIDCLDRLFVYYTSGGMKRMPALPQVKEVTLFNWASWERPDMDPPLEILFATFPNLEVLKIPEGFPYLEFTAARVPPSLRDVSVVSKSPGRGQRYSDLVDAHTLASAKMVPSIDTLNGVPAGAFDPLWKLTPDQLERYGALPGYIWAEREYARRG